MIRLSELYTSVEKIIRHVLFLGPHTCPWWFAYTFDNPLRSLIHDPAKILGKFVSPGQTVVDIGCGLGYFSLALARLVGPDGRVIARDLQPQMVQRARCRAEREGLAERVDFAICSAERLGVTDPADFVLAFWVIHEVANQKGLLEEVKSFLKPGACLLIVEPMGHVSATKFSATVELAHLCGYHISDGPSVRFSRSVLCSAGSKPDPEK